MREARRLRVKGTVQGVGYRPFVARLAAAYGLLGWVRNDESGVEIHVEGAPPALYRFADALRTDAPAAARVATVESAAAQTAAFDRFEIRHSEHRSRATTRISPDLPVCDACLAEMRNPSARRFRYPFTNCSHCGPRFSIVRALPYDRERTTMAAWTMCGACRSEYHDPSERRFHAEPIACPECGPRYRLVEQGLTIGADYAAIASTAALLREGRIVAIKGIGGYHLSCDAANPAAVATLRERKVRKSQPFAVMVRDLQAAHALAILDQPSIELLRSAARPIVLVPARQALEGVAPDGYQDIGLMLPYAPIHELLFAAGAPDLLVMTSGNRSSEPIAFDDEDAFERLAPVADAFLVGDRAIARRIDDSVARADHAGQTLLRRSRGYAPGPVARLPSRGPILAVGADLKNTVTLVVDGQAFMSQHIGDLAHVFCYEAFQLAARDFLRMYEIDPHQLAVVHDLHPDYLSTGYALGQPASGRIGVQHHRAHIASVLAERGAFDTHVVGVAFDGAGYGDDGTIWGGEFFVGSVAEGLTRVASLRPFRLPGGDAAARAPLQAAAGVLLDVDGLPDLTRPPFSFSPRYVHARQLARSGMRTFTSTSAGRLFDTAAALLGFTEVNEFEGQAAMWLEQSARQAATAPALPWSWNGSELDFRPALLELVLRRLAGDDVSVMALAFHEAVAAGIAAVTASLCEQRRFDTVVAAGGTLQNSLLRTLLRRGIAPPLRLWLNREVPANDGGISLGQAALAAVATTNTLGSAELRIPQ